ncbi:MAG: L-lactate permease [candidate division KSB1 bacterium]|nr:L-lactate permease [candidate division KSB1 bacterium]
MSNYHGPWVVDIAGAIVSMAAMVVLLQFWQPQSIWRFQHDNDTESELTT